MPKIQIHTPCASTPGKSSLRLKSRLVRSASTLCPTLSPGIPICAGIFYTDEGNCVLL